MGATRRRGEVLEAAIRQAVLAELAEHGYGGTTYEGVAARAGTSKPVLYRRWSSKAEMVAAANVRSNLADVEAPDTGTLAGDLRGLVRQVRSVLGLVGRTTLLALMADLPAGSTASLRMLLLDEGTHIVEPVVERARSRGELGPAPLPGLVLGLPFDLVRHEYVVGGPLSDRALDEIVDQVLLPLFGAAAAEPRG